MTRRAFLTAIGVPITGIAMPSVGEAAGLHLRGQLVSDTSDLQLGYYAVCGLGTGACKAEDAIGISIHPKNTLYEQELRQMVGQTVHISIFT